MHESMIYYQARVPGLEKRGTDFRAPCPIHGGKNEESFSVDPTSGRWFCHSVCNRGGDAIELEKSLSNCGFQEAVRLIEEIAPMSITVNAPPTTARKPKEKVVQFNKTMIATYDYQDAEGTLIFQVVRYRNNDTGAKDFRQRRPDGSGGWVYSLRSVEPILYRLPAILTTPGPVWIVEGEKDANNAARLGLNVTCNPMGAGKFRASMARAIAGREVFIVPDNDKPGAEHAVKVSQLCRLEGCIVKTVHLPGPGKDLTEWMDAGGTLEQLMALATAAPIDGEGEVEAVRPPSTDGAPANVIEMLKNYVILTGSSMIWDSRRQTTVTPNDVRLSHANDYTAWVKHPEVQRVDVERLVFKPQGSDPGEMNIFTGIKMQPNPEGECGRIVDHVQLLCGSDGDLFHWVLSWLAYPLQHLGAKMMTSIVVHSPQGSGKNLFFGDVMCRIYGEYGAVIGQTEVESTFTGWASRKLFVVADEVISRAERAALKNRIKALITGDKLSIEEKYQARRTEENHMSMVFLSNEDIPVFIEAGDRRFTVISVPEVFEPQYYSDLAHEIHSGGVPAFYHFLLNYNTGNFHPHTKPFETKAKQEIVKSCAPPAERFLNEWEAGELPVPFGCCTTADLFGAFKVWAHVSGEKFIGTQTAFSRVASKRYKRAAGRTIDSQWARFNIPNGVHSADEANSFSVKLEHWLKEEQRAKL